MTDHTVILDETVDDGVVCESQQRTKSILLQHVILVMSIDFSVLLACSCGKASVAERQTRRHGFTY